MKTHQRSLQLMFLLLLSLVVGGCGSMGKLKNYFAGTEPKKPAAQAKETPIDPSVPDVVERDSMGQVPQRHYGRMSRTRMEQEAQLNPKSGSLWRMEGQGAYLFSDNNFRLMGDLLNVKLDGAPKDQLTSKAKVIRELWKKLERARPPANAQAKGGKPGEGAAGGEAGAAPAEGAKPADGGGSNQAAAGVNTDDVDAGGEDKPLPVEVIPTRVVERLGDGNYRVEGAQSFMIGKHEYKVLVAGIVRSQDFNDESLASTRLMDPKFDIVATKKASGVTK